MVFVNITGSLNFPQGTPQETSQRTPTNDIERRCEGRTDSINIDSCKENGRICESKSIDCKIVNIDGYEPEANPTNIPQSWIVVIIIISMIIFGYTFFKNKYTQWRF